MIIFNLIVPEGNLCYFACVFAVFVAPGELQCGNFFHALHHAVNHIGIIGVRAVQDGDSGVVFLVMVFYPHAKAGKAGGEGGNPEGKGLQRGVAPRFVVRREKGQVHTAEKVVVAHVEYAVVPVKVGRDEIDLHLVADGVDKAGFPEAAGDGVVFRVLEVVGRLRLVVGVALPCQFGHHVAVRTMVPGRDHDKGLDASALIAAAVEFIQRVDEYVDALVPELVPAADANVDGIGRNLLRAHGAGHCTKALTGGVMQLIVLLI